MIGKNESQRASRACSMQGWTTQTACPVSTMGEFGGEFGGKQESTKSIHFYVTLFKFLSSFRNHHSNSVKNFFLAGFEAVVFTLAECFKEKEGFFSRERGFTCARFSATAQFFQIYSSYSLKLAKSSSILSIFFVLEESTWQVPHRERKDSIQRRV